MSQLKLSGDASGTGIVTVAAPNTNSTYTVTLPAAAGTLVNDTGGQTVQFALGSASAPSVTFTGDTNTGVFSSGADTVNFATGGSEQSRITSGGLLLVGTTTASSNAQTKQVLANGAGTYLQITKTNATAGGLLFGTDGSSTRIYTHTGAVGSETLTQVFEVAKDKSLALQSATSQTGIGITFPADTTSTVSSNANTLDDYEEGSWTPNQGAGLTVSGSFQSVGTYIKIGRLVVVRGSVGASTSVSISPNGVICSNLPFSNGGSSSGNSYEFGTGSSVQRNGLATGGQVAADQNTSLYSTSTYTAVTAFSFVCTYITA